MLLFTCCNNLIYIHMYIVFSTILLTHLIHFLYIGCGKTHYIRKQLNSGFHDDRTTISINETFTSHQCIRKLKQIPVDKFNAAIYLNISLILMKVHVCLLLRCHQLQTCASRLFCYKN